MLCSLVAKALDERGVAGQPNLRLVAVHLGGGDPAGGGQSLIEQAGGARLPGESPLE